MKNVLLIAIALLTYAVSLTAQAPSKEVVKLADEACTCFAKNNPIKDKEFDKTLDKVIKMSPDQAEAYMKTLPEDQQTRFTQNMEKLEKLDRASPDFNKCIESWEQTAKAYLRQQEASGLTEEKILEQFREEFKKKKKCHALALLLQG